MQLSKHVNQSLLTLRILCLVFFLQPIVLGFILLNGTPRGPMGLGILQSSTGQILSLSALIAFIAGFVIHKTMLSQIRIRKVLERPWNKEQLELQTRKGQRLYSDEKIKELLALPSTEVPLAKIIPTYFLAHVISFAAFEACSLLGFLLATNLKNATYYAPFIALTYIGLIALFPTYEKMKATADSGR